MPLRYKTVNGNTYTNDALYSNRLWLGMGYAPTEDMLFRGQLAYHKAFGASYGQRGTGFGFDTFDWVSSETLADDKLRVREAYWLWNFRTGTIGWAASVGRRPSTNGFLSNLREDDAKAKSPMGHVINMEFDGASVTMKLDHYVQGMYAKLCLGRGLTNAAGWASEATAALGAPMGGSSQPNFTKVDGELDTVDMAGFIFVPYDSELLVYLIIIIASMMSGFLDDASKKPWNEYKKGLIDAVIAFACAFTYVKNNGTGVHLLFSGKSVNLPEWLYIILAMILIWAAINVVNCTDGVDGLCAMLAVAGCLSFIFVFITCG